MIISIKHTLLYSPLDPTLARLADIVRDWHYNRSASASAKYYEEQMSIFRGPSVISGGIVVAVTEGTRR